MNPLRPAKTLALAAALAWSVPLAASAAQAGVTPGMQVVGPNGGVVGTVTKVTGGQLVVKTDKHEVLLPATSFTPNEGKLLFAMTRDQLNAATDKALAEADAKLVPGTEVYGQAGNLAGRIEAIDEETVTVMLTTDKKVRMPRASIAPGPKGAVLGLSAEALEQLVNQSN